MASRRASSPIAWWRCCMGGDRPHPGRSGEARALGQHSAGRPWRVRWRTRRHRTGHGGRSTCWTAPWRSPAMTASSSIRRALHTICSSRGRPGAHAATGGRRPGPGCDDRDALSTAFALMPVEAIGATLRQLPAWRRISCSMTARGGDPGRVTRPVAAADGLAGELEGLALQTTPAKAEGPLQTSIRHQARLAEWRRNPLSAHGVR